MGLLLVGKHSDSNALFVPFVLYLLGILIKFFFTGGISLLSLPAFLEIILIGAILLVSGIYLGNEPSSHPNTAYQTPSYLGGPDIRQDTAKREEEARKRTITNGGWVCFQCHDCNPANIPICRCGMSRTESERLEKEEKAKVTQDDQANAIPSPKVEITEGAWECLNCHSINDASKKMCKSCGQIKMMGYKDVEITPAPVGKKTCPACGAQVDSDALFCEMCGTKLS